MSGGTIQRRSSKSLKLVVDAEMGKHWHTVVFDNYHVGGTARLQLMQHFNIQPKYPQTSRFLNFCSNSPTSYARLREHKPHPRYLCRFGVFARLYIRSISSCSSVRNAWPVSIYIICNFLFVIFCAAGGLATNMGMLIAFRFLMGVAGVAPLTIGGGSIADLIPVEKRGAAMSIWAIGPLASPVIAPVCERGMSWGCYGMEMDILGSHHYSLYHLLRAWFVHSKLNSLELPPFSLFSSSMKPTLLKSSPKKPPDCAKKPAIPTFDPVSTRK